MIFDQFCRCNAIKNILPGGLGVTAPASFNVAANNYAASHTYLKVAKVSINPVAEL